MDLHLTKTQFRRLLDMVYIGNWILNSTREDKDRIQDYDDLESLMFAKAAVEGMPELAEIYHGMVIPSRAFEEGGIQEAIADYEDAVFYEILAEELTRRDMNDEEITESNLAEYTERMENYISEFEKNGTDNVCVETDDNN